MGPFKKQAEKDVLKSAFDRMDVDGSGNISLEEMKTFLEDLQWDLDARDAFNYLDKDTSDSLSFAEFLRWKAFAWDHQIIGQHSPTDFDSNLEQIAEQEDGDEWSGDEAKEEKEEEARAGDVKAGEAARAYLDNLYDRAENETAEGVGSNVEEPTPSAYGTIPVDADPELNEMDSDMFASLYLEELMAMVDDQSTSASQSEATAA